MGSGMTRSRPTHLLSRIMAASIRAWVRVTGRAVDARDAAWLRCPMGTTERIGSGFYSRLAEEEALEIRSDPEGGLLTSFDALKGTDFDPDRVHPRVRDFYEHTAAYRMEAWSEAGSIMRVFLWALTRFVSRPMNQLNFPVSSLELAGGMSSDVLPMFDASGRRVYTGWLRRLPSLDRVIYTGLYSVERPPRLDEPCVKVTFPVPRGSATVFLRPRVGVGGTFQLVSAGRRFGDEGFYRIVDVGNGRWRVRYIRTLREHFDVYVDGAGALRCDHRVRFLGLKVLHLHYRMDRVGPERESVEELAARTGEQP